MTFSDLMANSINNAASKKETEYRMGQYLDKLRDMCGVVPTQMMLCNIVDYCAIVYDYAAQQDAPNQGMHYFLRGRELLNQLLYGMELDIENNDIFVGTILQDLTEVKEVIDDGIEDGCENEELGDDWDRQYPPLFTD